MKWYLLVMLVNGIEIEPMDSKWACDTLRQEIVSAYGSGSGLIAARCIAIPDSGTKR